MNIEIQESLPEYFSSLPDFSLKMGKELQKADYSLERMDALVNALGNPEKKFPSLHIAGSNGKGSVAAFCAAAYQAQGYKIGLYTSPHLAGPLEGIRVNSNNLGAAQARSLLKEMRSAMENIQGLSLFEASTALAFAFFAKEEVDLALIEAGLGGRLDATNVLSPLLSLITPIDLEHVTILGRTLEEIASHKAGIIKVDTPLLLAKQAAAVRNLFLDVAQTKNAPVVEIGKDVQLERISFDNERQEIEISGFAKKIRLNVNLLGKHQAENATLAYSALQMAKDRGLAISDQSIRAAFAHITWPGRFEIIDSKPILILDSAHTPAATQALSATLSDHFPDQQFNALIGISSDKDLFSLMVPIAPHLKSITATQSAHPRAMDSALLMKDLAYLKIKVENQPDPQIALQDLIARSDSNAPILIFGSVFLVEQLRPLLLSVDGSK